MDRVANNSMIAHKLFIRNCGKCHTGKIYIESDTIDGECEVCYACGYRHYLQTELPVTKKQTY